ncbi:hypothetical protein CYMTET_30876, partial [Cymbomonas tetramitiformis]
AASPEKDVPEPSFVPGELAGAASKLAGSQENEDPAFQSVKKRGVSADPATAKFTPKGNEDPAFQSVKKRGVSANPAAAKFTPKVSAPLVTYLS